MTDPADQPPSPDAERIAQAIRATPGQLLVVTGAGVSLASGIPTFRGTDEGAVWKHDVMEMATYSFFRRDPVESWRWYLSRFETLRSAEPNPAHGALVDLERWVEAERVGAGGPDEFLLITQNVDGLHEVAGSRELVEVHGSNRWLRCASDGCRLGAPRGRMRRSDQVIETFLAAPGPDTVPRCPECGDLLRPHVLWFDEFYGEHGDYQWERVQDAARRASLVLFVGTSFSVGVTDLIAQYAAARRVPIWSIDPGATPPPYSGIELLTAAAETALPEIVERLRRAGHE